jgi:hypothetical protein
LALSSLPASSSSSNDFEIGSSIIGNNARPRLGRLPLRSKEVCGDGS